jgi:DNA replication and repair protein RecF
LALRRVRITGVRCVAEADLALSPQRNVIFGPNGAGKTSLLEAIYVLSRGRSFRTRHLRRLIQHGSRRLAVFGEVVADGPRVRRLGIAFEDGRLERRVEGKSGASGVELATLLPVHVIEPGSHELIQGAPSERRRFLDWGAFHVEHSYLDAWRRYRRVLSHRNAALKAGASAAEIDSWTAALIEVGLEVHRRRELYVAQLASCFHDYGRALLGAELVLTYRSGWRSDLSLAQALMDSADRDRASGNTETGPHRADLAIKLEGRMAQDEASRGQQKLAAAALVLAQARVFEVHHAAPGILLIDDAAAELDTAALERFMRALASLSVQMIFTALTPDALPLSSGGAVFHVERGAVRAL